MIEVGNGMFGRNWKVNCEDHDAISKDTLPTRKNIKEKLNLIEAETLEFAVEVSC